MFVCSSVDACFGLPQPMVALMPCRWLQILAASQGRREKRDSG
jgi:hypothetical protein